MASIILDDTTSLLSTAGDNGATWSRVIVQRFFNQSAIYPAFAASSNGDTGSYGSLSIAFRGTSISFIGNTPLAVCSQNVFVSIDGGTPYNTSYSDPSPPSARQWYQSPVLSDGPHSIEITHIAGTSVDYMVVTAGPKTPLSGQRLIVDDDDSAIVYSQNWARKTGPYKSQDAPSDGLPYGNVTHQSSTPGSTATFLFAGTSVAVYSLFDYSHLGDLSVLYTLDSTPFLKSHSVTTNTPEFRNGVLQRENVLLFSNDGLKPGPHTLTIEIKSTSNQAALSLDYILYTPSFDTLSAKPNLTPVSSTASGSSSSSLIASGSGSLPPAVTGSGHLSSSTGGVEPTTSAGITSGSSTHKSTPIGAIVGGVIGGVALFFFILLLFLCRKRFIRRTQSSVPPTVQGSQPIEPFTGMIPDPVLQDMKYQPFSFVAAAPNVTPSANGSRNGDNSVIGSTISNFPQEKSLLLSANPGPTAALTPIRRDDSLDAMSILSAGGSTTGGGGGTALRSRMQRLQDLVSELNREISENGENSIQVAVLRGRVAELTREDAEIGNRELAGPSLRTSGTTVPPPYEPQRE